jgi:Bacteriophage related domain of unknown function
MAILSIKKALEKKLAALTPNISTAYESFSFTPVPNVPYQRVQVIPRKPDNPTMGDSYYRENGEFQVFLAYPSNVGTGQVLAQAELVQQHFARGTTITEGSLEVIIPRTPQIAGSTVVGDRIVVPVIIQYYVGILA